jgi:hypothetical protein
MGQIVEGADNVPAVQLALVESLRAGIQAACVSQSHRVSGRKQPECGVRSDHASLIQQGEFSFDFENPVDEEHDIRTARIVFRIHRIQVPRDAEVPM